MDTEFFSHICYSTSSESFTVEQFCHIRSCIMFSTDVRTSLLLFVKGVIITYHTVGLSVSSHVMFITLFSKLVHQIW